MISNGNGLDRNNVLPLPDNTHGVGSMRPRRSGRNWTMIALAVAVAVPPGMMGLSQLRASDSAALQPPAASDLPLPIAPAPALDGSPAVASPAPELPAGTPPAIAAPNAPVASLEDSIAASRALSAHGRFEDASKVLGRLDAGKLSDADRKMFLAEKAAIEMAIGERKNARDALMHGEEARLSGRSVEAAQQYQTAINNRYADAATRQKAQDELLKVSQPVAPIAAAPAGPISPTDSAAATPTGPTMAGLSPREQYLLAKEEYKAGDYRSAKRNFQAAQVTGYTAPLGQDSPERYLSHIIDRERELSAQQSAASVLAADVTPAPAVPASPAPFAPAQFAPAPVASAAAAAPATAPASGATPGGVTPGNVTVADIAGPATDAAKPATSPSTLPAGVAPQNLAAQNQAEQDLHAAEETDVIRRQAAAFHARQLVDEGDKLAADGHLKDAQDKYVEATQLDPQNEFAKNKLNDTLSRLGTAPEHSAIDGVIEFRKGQLAEIAYNFAKAKEDFEQQLLAGEFAAARTDLEKGRAAVINDGGVLSREQVNGYNTTLLEMSARLTQTETRVHDAAVLNGNIEAAKKIETETRRVEEQKRRTIQTLIVAARRLTDEAKYGEAIGVVDQILLNDPTNDYALGVRPLLLDRKAFSDQRKYRERFDVEVTKQLNAAEEKKIPYDDILRFPADWPDISTVRDQTVQSEHGQSTEERAITAQLDRKLPEMKLDNIGFTDAIDYVRDISQTNIFVNWKALEAAGIDRNQAVNLRLFNVKVSKALNIILDSVSSATAKLAYTIDEGVITISTNEDLGKNVLTRVYDIRDLIIDIPNFTDAPDFDLTQQNNSGGGSGGGGGGGGGGGSGGGLFGQSATQNKDKDAGKTKEQLVEDITKLIQETVAPDSWRDTGGMVGSVKELSGQLIVTQTPENHHALNNLLDQLREQKSIQVTVEARFLTVQRNFLEDVGMDFDFIFNVAGANSRKLSPIIVNNDSSTFTAGPTTSIPGSIGTTAQGLTTAATFLDDFQVNFLLRATQANQTSTVVTAPRVTLFNGQRAYVLVATQRAYVSDLEPSVGQNTSSFKPTVSIVESGVLLDVQATVSADRKYVTLTLRPQLSQLIALRDFVFQNGNNATSNPAGGAAPIFIGGQGGEAPSGIIQTPEIQITEVRTTVTVPDGGTLLLGGQTLAGEIEKEAGVPILSKIPGLKRLFTNRSMAKDEQILLILVRPTIIISKEVEQRQFPLLNTRT